MNIQIGGIYALTRFGYTHEYYVEKITALKAVLRRCDDPTIRPRFLKLDGTHDKCEVSLVRSSLPIKAIAKSDEVAA